ncbi:hypothetical protein CHS0354_026811 [Potamilus streckersoni]|uniref:Dolichol-phosphate mannosyltransferase subunit 1 n=1 Tax=Potamilus streckersoni TaxID=2493646 RepID=A0AAE0T586_9BIVA|nr:hypothetical protein CHS0354_026811 [Potamilus streckersoni]
MPRLSVIIPTYKEAKNISPLYEKLKAVLVNLDWELVFVDDHSPDLTYRTVGELCAQDKRVRLVHRIHRKGLSSATIEGMLSVTSEFIAVMDADMQHDEAVLPKMLQQLTDNPGTDIVIGSRYTDGGSTGEWSALRKLVSKTGTALTGFFGVRATTDPMSGFFMLRASFLEKIAPNLSGIGFKILLDIIMSAGKNIKTAEVPYTFKKRVHGESKLGIDTILDLGFLLADKRFGALLPLRFLLFILVGGIGMLIHLGIMYALEQFYGHRFFADNQLIAGTVTIAFNYLLDNLITFKENRRRGAAFFFGLIKFYLVCAIGLLGNVLISVSIYNYEFHWVLAAMAGAFYGGFVNFSLSRILIWKDR